MKMNQIVLRWTVSLVAILLLAGCGVPLPVPMGGFSQPDAEDILPTPAPTADPLTIVEEGGVMATIGTRSLRVRSEPDDNSDVVAGVAEGESYRVVALSDDGLWVELALNNAEVETGWVSTNFVLVEGELTSLTAPPAAAAPAGSNIGLTLVPTPEGGFARVNTTGVRLRVRSGPDTEDEIVGYVYEGEQYPVLERSDDGLWVRIPASGGENPDNSAGGWVAAEYLAIGE